MNCRLGMNELLDDSHMPVLMVMNMVKEKRFLEVLKALSKGNSFGEEYGACTLPEDLDDFDKANGEDLDGAEFLKILCDKYVKYHMEQADIVNGLLDDFSDKYLKAIVQ
ncbi:hypothetical protein [uncultured Acetatifactor sp.]|uniref:hypothetical protein n=1 Tax=uncultured Acetatifactor sp. TaxID=1671927 RepID=UPI002632E3D8|nr:hypothetical protein [uncultured Acetatifactor sp.]